MGKENEEKGQPLRGPARVELEHATSYREGDGDVEGSRGTSGRQRVLIYGIWAVVLGAMVLQGVTLPRSGLIKSWECGWTPISSGSSASWCRRCWCS